MKPSRRARSALRALQDQLGAIYAEPSGLFHKLVETAGLAPQRDFRDRDLRDICFTGADLRGFDFSRSDLRGTRLREAGQFDITTIVEDAMIDQDDRDSLRGCETVAAAATPAPPGTPATSVGKLASSGNLLRLPITAATAGSGYTLALSVGSQNTQVTAILDTGSSMAAVLSQVYDPSADSAATTTQILQSGTFGGGGFLAAVVQAPVGLAGAGVATPITLATANLGVVYNVNQSPFGRAFGILGLAYPALSPANRMPGNTWTTKYTQADFRAAPSAEPVAPYLDQLVAAGQVTNKFAFSVQRSFKSQGDDGDQLNTGIFVLGDCEECTDLFKGDFASVPIVHESYYSTNLLAIKIGNQTIQVPPLPAGSPAASNAFVDSGCNYLQFETDLYQRIIEAFSATNGAALKAGQAAQAQLDLADWPNIELILEGAEGSQITLTVEPKDYWQFDSLGPGTARPALSTGAAPYPGQSILGLPLFAGHYVVFDRTGGPGRGVIKFAAQPAANTAPLTS